MQADWFGWSQICISAISAKSRLGHDRLLPLGFMPVVQIEKSAASGGPVRPVEMAGSPLADLPQIGFILVGFVHRQAAQDTLAVGVRGPMPERIMVV